MLLSVPTCTKYPHLWSCDPELPLPLPVEPWVLRSEYVIMGTSGTVLYWMLKKRVIDPAKITMFVPDEADVMIDQQTAGPDHPHTKVRRGRRVGGGGRVDEWVKMEGGSKGMH